jgi:hypothetical protein
MRGRELTFVPIQSALRRAVVLPILHGGPFLMYVPGTLTRCVYIRKCVPGLRPLTLALPHPDSQDVYLIPLCRSGA